MSPLLWVLLSLVALLGLGYVVLRILMMGKNGVLLAVTWSAGIDEDRKPVKWMQAPKLPRLLGATSTVIGRKVCSQKAFAEASDGHKRAELWHVKQQAGAFLPWWMAQFLLIPSFRKHVETEAHAQENASHPTWRIVGVVSSNWWLWSVVLLLASCGPGPVTPETTAVREVAAPSPATWDARTTWAPARLLHNGELLTWGDVPSPADSRITVSVTVRLAPDGLVAGSIDDYPIEPWAHPRATALLLKAAKGTHR